MSEPRYRILSGKVEDVLPTLEAESFDCVLTDPPYGLSPDGKARTSDDVDASRSRGGFMGSAWDATVPGASVWREVLRVLRPGAYMLAAGGTRTQHRLVSSIEDGGFEIKDSISWIFGSGFPKSLSVGKSIDKALGAERTEVIGTKVLDGNAAIPPKERGGTFTAGVLVEKGRTKVIHMKAPATPQGAAFEGHFTALKPAVETFSLSMKPLDGTYAQNALKHGVAGLNIDACRVAHGEKCKTMKAQEDPGGMFRQAGRRKDVLELKPNGRWPSNLLLDAEAAAALDEQTIDSGQRCAKGDSAGTQRQTSASFFGAGSKSSEKPVGFGDGNPGASRFYQQCEEDEPALRFKYASKVSTRERNMGLEGHDMLASDLTPAESHFAEAILPQGACPVVYRRESMPEFLRNYLSVRAACGHATMKPLSLTTYLAKLLLPPYTGRPRRCIVPFGGVGSEAIGALLAGFEEVVMIEMSPEYCEIAEARIKHWLANPPKKKSNKEKHPDLPFDSVDSDQ